jgi:hypothetical protein
MTAAFLKRGAQGLVTDDEAISRFNSGKMNFEEMRNRANGLMANAKDRADYFTYQKELAIGVTDCSMGRVRCRCGRKRLSFAACSRSQNSIATSIFVANLKSNRN